MSRLIIAVILSWSCLLFLQKTYFRAQFVTFFFQLQSQKRFLSSSPYCIFLIALCLQVKPILSCLYSIVPLFTLFSQQPYAPPPHPMAPPSPSTNSCNQGGAEQLSKTNLYIRGLPPGTTDQDLIKLCQPWVFRCITVCKEYMEYGSNSSWYISSWLKNEIYRPRRIFHTEFTVASALLWH